MVQASNAPGPRQHRQGRRFVALALSLLWLAGGIAVAADTAPEASVTRAVALIDAGQFQTAEADIAKTLAQPDVPAATRTALEFQRERMRRILLDFSLTAADVKAQVRKKIPDLTDAEFDRWDAHGMIEHQIIDGRRLYFKRSPGNLFLLSPEAAARRKLQSPLGNAPDPVTDRIRADRKAALAGHTSSVLPRRVRMTQLLTVDADAGPAGETVRAWIPYPQDLPGQQEDIRFVASVPAQHQIAPASTAQRTVYLEKTAQAGQPTQFSITYELTIYDQDHAIDPARVTMPKITPELAPYVAERAPHVVFTEPMRLFSAQVLDGETNPYRIVQKLFAAVDRLPWAGAREYSTISNISDYALHAGHGDCGQQTLLLITLLRMNGIPARWQSGMIFSEGDYSNIHDWGQVYLPPYGWVPMDVTTGRLQTAPGDDPSLAWFYLGGLDSLRIAFNSDFGQTFDPPKQHFRSDNVDSQRGEVEWKGGNLYFNQWDYDFKWQILPTTRDSAGKDS
jgi:transglutaminase-like putative cysteine protease